jgi:hypothetical protein
VALAAQRFYQEAEIPVINNVATGTIITNQFNELAVIGRVGEDRDLLEALRDRLVGHHAGLQHVVGRGAEARSSTSRTST